MSRSIRSVGVTLAALTSIGAIGVAVVTTVASAGGTAPTSEGAAVAAESTSGGSTTSGVPAFVDGEDARLAAEELLAVYIESQLGVAATDAACSVPATGDVGEQFVCYALKPGELVVALRATIGEQRLVELELLLDQTTPTTTSTTAPPGQSATTDG